MPVPSSRDRDRIRAGLARWLSERVGSRVEVSELGVPDGAGFSSETFLFDATWDGVTRPLVCRMAPDDDDLPVFPTYDLGLQVGAMAMVRERAPTVPVPNVRWYEPDPGPLGGEFYVMDRVRGRGAPDYPPYVFGSWITEASPAERRRVQDHTLDLMAAIHAIEVDDTVVGLLSRPRFGDTPLDQHLGHERWYYEWARDGVVHPLIERAFDWLEAHRPATDPVGVNWGDARIGNILFDVDGDLSPTAVVDWEMACLGAPEADVAWQLVLHHFFCDIAAVLEMDDPVPDLFRVDDVVEHYEASSGRRLTDLEWYYVFGHLRFAIISLRTSRRAIASGDMAPPDEPGGLVSNARVLEATLAGTNPYWER